MLPSLTCRLPGVTVSNPITPTSRRAQTAAESAQLDSALDNFYDVFTARVAESRGLSRDEVQERAQGRVWSGARAKEQRRAPRQSARCTGFEGSAVRAELAIWGFSYSTLSLVAASERAPSVRNAVWRRGDIPCAAHRTEPRHAGCSTISVASTPQQCWIVQQQRPAVVRRLVDHLGGVDTAVALVKREAGIAASTHVTLREVSSTRPSLRSLLSAGGLSAHIGAALRAFLASSLLGPTFWDPDASAKALSGAPGALLAGSSTEIGRAHV